MNKIRTLIAYGDKESKEAIVNLIKSIDYVEIVGTAEDANETYNKIVELQPEMVFAEYSMSDMNGIELIKKSKEKLESKTPIFNIIGDDIPYEELDKNSDYIGENLNALIESSNNKDRIINVLKEYKEYKEFMNIN